MIRKHLAPQPAGRRLSAGLLTVRLVVGAALIPGSLVPFATLGLMCTMAVAAYTHISRSDPFVGRRSNELALVFFAIALLLRLQGPGRLSIDALIFRREEKSS